MGGACVFEGVCAVLDTDGVMAAEPWEQPSLAPRLASPYTSSNYVIPADQPVCPNAKRTLACLGRDINLTNFHAEMICLMVV